MSLTIGGLALILVAVAHALLLMGQWQLKMSRMLWDVMSSDHQNIDAIPSLMGNLFK